MFLYDNGFGVCGRNRELFDAFNGVRVSRRTGGIRCLVDFGTVDVDNGLRVVNGVRLMN